LDNRDDRRGQRYHYRHHLISIFVVKVKSQRIPAAYTDFDENQSLYARVGGGFVNVVFLLDFKR